MQRGEARIADELTKAGDTAAVRCSAASPRSCRAVAPSSAQGTWELLAGGSPAVAARPASASSSASETGRPASEASCSPVLPAAGLASPLAAAVAFRILSSSGSPPKLWRDSDPLRLSARDAPD